MLGNKGFDLWANRYDESVGLTEEKNEYPFAGYRAVLGHIYSAVMARGCRRVLDIGFGTGTLTAALYGQGLEICGQDFSRQMIELARQKMPRAMLFEGDFSRGLVPELACRDYDAVVATYSLHHLTDGQKGRFIRQLLSVLRPGGVLYIGDVAFATCRELEECRRKNEADWDDDEWYFVYEQLRQQFPDSSFTALSHCAGVIEVYGAMR